MTKEMNDLIKNSKPFCMISKSKLNVNFKNIINSDIEQLHNINNTLSVEILKSNDVIFLKNILENIMSQYNLDISLIFSDNVLNFINEVYKRITQLEFANSIKIENKIELDLGCNLARVELSDIKNWNYKFKFNLNTPLYNNSTQEFIEYFYMTFDVIDPEDISYTSTECYAYDRNNNNLYLQDIPLLVQITQSTELNKIYGIFANYVIKYIKQHNLPYGLNNNDEIHDLFIDIFDDLNGDNTLFETNEFNNTNGLYLKVEYIKDKIYVFDRFNRFEFSYSFDIENKNYDIIGTILEEIDSFFF